DLREVAVGRRVARCLGDELRPDSLELAGIEEDAAALRTLVDRHGTLHAPEVAHHHDAVRVARTDVALLGVNVDVRVTRDVEERLAGGLGLLVDLLQLEVVEPDAATAAVADVDRDIAGSAGRQSMAAGRAGHASRYRQAARRAE